MIVSELVEKLIEMPENAEVFFVSYKHSDDGEFLKLEQHPINRVWDYRGVQVALDYVK